MSMPPPRDRIHSLDAVRAIAMFLGIFLHAALPYSLPGFRWPIFDSSRSLPLTLVLFALHAFRMPAFFLVAGFFARELHARLGFAGFVRHRLRRILLPLVAAWVVLFPSLRFAWAWGSLRSLASGGAVAPAQALSLAFSPSALLSGFGFGHLWFLYYLLIVYAAFLLARHIVLLTADADSSLRPKLDDRIRALVSSPALALAFAVPTTLLLLPMKSWGIDSPDASLVPQLRSVLLYLAFFAFGWLLARQQDLVGQLARRWLLHVAAGCVALGSQLAFLYAVTRPGPTPSVLLRAAFFANYALVSWSLTLALVALCARFLSSPNRWLRYAADASYWMYLVHLPLLLLMGFVLADVPLPWPVKLALALVAVVPVLLGSYHALVRFTWVGVFLNGRRHVRTRPAAVATARTDSVA